MDAAALQSIGSTLLLDVARYGYLALAAGVLLENAGLPVPGETMLLAAAALAAKGRLSIVIVAVVAASAAIVGDNIGFTIGRLGGRPLLHRFGKWLWLTPERLARVDRFYERRGPIAVAGARFVPGVRVVGALVAGTSDMHWLTFLLYNAIGAAAWASAMSTVGYAGTDLARVVLPYLRSIHVAAWALILIAAMVVLVHALYEAEHERLIARAARRRKRGS